MVLLGVVTLIKYFVYNNSKAEKGITKEIKNFDLDFDLVDVGKIKVKEERQIDPKINEFICNEAYGQTEEEKYTVIELKKADVKVFSESDITDESFKDLPEDQVVKLYIKSVDKDGKFTFKIDGKGKEYQSKALGKRTAFMNMVLMARCKQNLSIRGNLKNKFKFLVTRGRQASKEELQSLPLKVMLAIIILDGIRTVKIKEIKFEDLGNSETALKDLKTVKEGIEELPKKEKYIFEDLIKKSPLSFKRLDIKKLRKMSIKDVSTVDIDFAAKNNEKFLLPIEDHYFERKALSVDMNSLETRNKKSALLQEKLAGKTIPYGGVALFSKFIEQTENNKMSLNKKVVLEIFESEKEDKSEKERVEKRIKEKIIKNGIDGSVEIDWFVREGDFLPKARIEKEIFNLKKEYIGNPYLMNLLLLTLAKNHLETEKHLPNIDGDGKGFFIDTKSKELKLLSKTRKNFITMVKEIKAKILRENNMVDIIKDTRKDLDLQEFKDALKKFADIQKDVPTMLTLDENIPVMEVGDIHNNQAALEHAIMEFLKKKQKGEKVYLLFSGDYSDRGQQGPYEEGSAPDAKVWYMLMKLKILYQDDVFLLRGNHEDARLAHQFEAFERMKDYFESKGHEGGELRNLTKDVKECFFESLSVAAQHGKTLIMHGGLPAKNMHNLNEMFTELASSTDKNLPFEKNFNDKYVYEEKNTN